MRSFAIILWVSGSLLAACGSGGSVDSAGAGAGSDAGTTVVACHTGDGPNKGCSELVLPSAAAQAFKDTCEKEGSQALDSCPSANADAKCTPKPGALGGLTPTVMYWYGLADADDISDASADCAVLSGQFEQL